MIFDQNCDFLDFLEILSQSLETHLSYHYNIKKDCFGTKMLPIFLLLNESLAEVHVPAFLRVSQ